MKLPFLMFLSKLWTDSCSVDHASFSLCHETTEERRPDLLGGVCCLEGGWKSALGKSKVITAQTLD